MAIINKVNVGGTNYDLVGSAFYGTCSTAAGTAAKTVAVDGSFTLYTGATVTVKFTTTNTAANPTLNVDSTGAKAIYYNGAAITAGYLKANKVYSFVYNGTQWDFIGDIDTDSQRSYGTSATAVGSTASAGSASTVSRSDHVHSLSKSAVTTALGYTPPTTDTTYSVATTSAAGLMSAADKTKINNTNIAYGTCSTAAATAAKVITISGNTNWTLTAGSLIMIKFTETNTAENPTFNVNGTGAKSVWYSTSVITTSSLSYAGYANRPATYMYDGTQFVFVSWSYDTNTTYTNVKLGHGYATCSTAAATTAKTASLSSYTLTTGGIVAVKFTYDVPAGATLNINSKGAKNIYHKGAAITAGVIKAGDTATFIYSTRYHLISLDRDTSYSAATQSAAGLMSAADKTKLDGIATGANNYTYTLPNATSSVLGGVKVGSNISVSSGTISLTKANVTSALGYTPPTTDTTYGVVSTTANGLAPKRDGSTTKFLRGDGTWAVPPDTNTTYSAATTSAAGLMSAADKTKLDGIATGANNYTYTLPNATSSTLGGVKVGSNISVSSGTISLSSANITGALGYTPLSTAGGTLTDNVTFNNGKGVMGKDSAGTAQYLMFLSTSNTLWIGYNMPSTYTAKFDVPIAGTLHLSGTTDASSTKDNNAPLIIGNRSGEHLVFDGNEIIPKSGATAGGTLYLGDSENTVISISGKFRVNSYSYGTSLPAAGTAGRVFFKKV